MALVESNHLSVIYGQCALLLDWHKVTFEPATLFINLVNKMCLSFFRALYQLLILLHHYLHIIYSI